MTRLNEFSLPLKGLKVGQHEFNFQIKGDFFKYFEASPIEKALIDVRLDFDKRPEMYIMDFHFTGTIHAECDRCLEFFDFPVDMEEQILVKIAEEEKDEAEIIYIIEDSSELNVAKYIYEFICLALPISKVHEDADLECNEKMLGYISGSDTNETAPEIKDKPSIWEELKKFKHN